MGTAMAMATDIIGHRYSLDTDIDNTHIFSYSYRYAHVDMHTRTYTLGYLPGTHSRPRHSIRGCLGNIPGNGPHPPPGGGRGWRLVATAAWSFANLRIAWRHQNTWASSERPRNHLILVSPTRHKSSLKRRDGIFERTANERNFNSSQFVFARRRCAGCWARHRQCSGLPMSGVPAAGSPLFLRKNHRNKLFPSLR